MRTRRDVSCEGTQAMAKCKGLFSSVTDTASEQKKKTIIGIWGGQWGMTTWNSVLLERNR